MPAVPKPEPGVESLSLPVAQRAMRECRRCADAGHPITPGAIFAGDENARILLIGQAPSATDRETGVPFSGPGGRRLFEWLARAGLDEPQLRKITYFTAITRCDPGRAAKGRGDRLPGRAEQELCRPFLEHELAILPARLVLLVGQLAIRRFLGARPLDLVVGTVERDEAGRWLVPLPHPSGASRWLNTPANADALERAIRHIARLRRMLGLPA
jgi:uracil-DNA glycosylase